MGREQAELKLQREEMEAAEQKYASKKVVSLSGIPRSPITKQVAQTSDYIKQTHRSKAGHYDAWGGQGLDEVISGSQKRGEMY